MNEWIESLTDLTAAGEPVVIVTVAGIRGSAPREVGARMLVTETETIGTIGGGQLEYQCTRRAVERLSRRSTTDVPRFPLGPSMGQCCGGVVEILTSPDGNTWTIIVTTPQGMSCLVAAGEGWRAVEQDLVEPEA